MVRRMFSTNITRSDAFLDMPHDSQLLYFQLCMSADDDGFVDNPKTIKRMIQASTDAVKLLLAKHFIIVFRTDLCVIKHWRINNYIRKQIYRPTTHQKEKKALFINNNGAYTQNPTEESIPVPDGYFSFQEVTSTQRRLSIGKDSIVKKEVELPDWLNKKAWKEWVEYRKEIKKKMTERTIKMQIKKLSQNKKSHVKMIEESISNGWTGLFAPTDTSSGNTGSSQGDKARAFDKRLNNEDETRYRRQNGADNNKRNEINKMSKTLSKKFSVEA